MFGKKKGQKKRKNMRIDTLIGQNTHVEGDIIFSGGLRIDGKVNGNIFIDSDDQAVLSLSERGIINGEIRVPYLLINGEVNGNIYASQHLELSSAARVTGNIFYQTLEMAVGSEVNGQMIHITADQAAETLQIDSSSDDDKPSLHLEKQD